ncbi:aspartate aminotransferase family protein [Teichococcus deserti]|nr:aspartate aminotransferase family protein [Pseudoroseomonas deserti]
MTQISGGMVNAFDPAGAAALDDSRRDMVERRARLLGPGYKLFYDEPVHFVRAQGVHLYDADGKEYLDVYNNVPSVGHCHPRVVEAVSRQLGVLNTHTRYLHDSILQYSEQLLATLPAEIGHVMYTCTGSEASDLAMRITRHVTGGTGFIVTANAYHGHTIAVSQASPSMGEHVPLGVHTRVVPAPDAYRTEGDLGAVFAGQVEAAIADLRRHGIRFAGFIADSLFSSDGILPGPAGFLKPVAEVVRKHGGLYIADEVQPGFARTGDAMWGFQRHGVTPDLVTMGKPMGNGIPIGGVAARPELLEDFGRNTRYFNTFGGSPVCIAAAQAVLDVIRDEKLQENSRIVGRAMLDGIQAMAEKHAAIGDVRGAGLFVGVDFVKDRATREPDAALGLRVVNRLREKRVLISASGKEGNVLKIRPPLPFSLADNDRFLGLLAETLAELA